MILQNQSDRAEPYVTKSPGLAAKALEAQGIKQAMSTNGECFSFFYLNDLHLSSLAQLEPELTALNTWG